MELVTFGQSKPQATYTRQQFNIPAALRPLPLEDGSVTLWQGYLLHLDFVTDNELDKAFAQLPPGDYSEERYEALQLAAKVQRLHVYPSSVELEYAQAQENAAAAQQGTALTPEMIEYAAKVEEANINVPMPSEPTFLWSDVVDASAPSTNFRFDPADAQFLQLQVGDRIRRTEPYGVMPYDAELLTISLGNGVTTWSESTTVTGTDVPFRVSTYRP